MKFQRGRPTIPEPADAAAAEPVAEAAPEPTSAAPTFVLVRPCVLANRTFNPGDEEAFLAAAKGEHPNHVKFFILAGSIAGEVPGIRIEPGDERELFLPPAEQ